MVNQRRFVSRGSLLILASWLSTGILHADDTVYRVDANGSHVYVRVNADGRLGHSHGIEGRVKAGQMQLGGVGQLNFDINSFVADTPAARQYVGLEGKTSGSDARKVTANMLSADVLDAAKYPTAGFAINSIKPLDNQPPGRPGRYQLDGQFTLHGVARPLKIVATAEAAKKEGWLRMRGQFTVLQTQYGIKPYTALGGLVGILDELTIYGDLFLQAESK